MNGSTRRELEERLHALARKEFVRRERRSSVEGDVEYTFLHALLRDVAYGQIPRADRAEKHARAAQWIEALGREEDTAEMLAHHYVQALKYARATSGDTAPLEKGARRALQEAGDRAQALSATAAAVAYFEQALDLCPPDDAERTGLLVRRATLALSHDGLEGAAKLETIHGELSERGDPTAAAEVAAILAWSYWQRGEPTRAEETLRAAAGTLEDERPSRAKAMVAFELARVHTTAGEPDAVAIAQKALAAAKEAGARDLEARALNTLGLARCDEGDREGIDDVEQSRALAEEIGSKLDVVRAHLNLAAIHSSLGDLKGTHEHLLTGLEEADRWGQVLAARWLRAETSELHYNVGEWDEALRVADEFVAEVEAGAAHYLEGPVRSRRALIYVARGDVAGALAEDERQIELARDIADAQVIRPGLAISAFVRFEAGETASANERLTELLHAVGTPEAHTPPEAEVAFAAVGLGRAEELAAAFEGARENPWFDAARTYAAGDYARAADMYEQIGTRPAAAYARLTAGDEANARRAREFYRSVGAAKYVARAEKLLRASA
jgi:hypothetical protein